MKWEDELDEINERLAREMAAKGDDPFPRDDRPQTRVLREDDEWLWIEQEGVTAKVRKAPPEHRHVRATVTPRDRTDAHTH